MLILFTKKVFLRKERRDPLLTMTIQVMSKQCWTRWTCTSEFQDYHILLWSMRRVPAFENWFRELRTTLIDTLFNKIYDKIKPITLLVQNQRNDSGSGQHRIVWIARDGSQNAVHSTTLILECRHHLLHMRAILAERNRGQSRFR